MAKYVVKSQAAIAEFFGVKLPTVVRWRQEGSPGEKGEWDLQAIAQWIVSRTKKKTEGTVWTERWQKERFLAARLRRRQVEGELVERTHVHQHLQTFATLLRQFGEKLQREYGPEAQDILDEMLDEFDLMMQKEISNISALIDQHLDDEAKDEQDTEHVDRQT